MGFGENVETGGGLAEEHYLTNGEQVKSSLERAFEPFGPFGDGGHLAEVAREKSDDTARLAEVSHADDDRVGFFGGHGGRES